MLTRVAPKLPAGVRMPRKPVFLLAVVTATGEVQDPRVIESDKRGLRPAIEDAVRRWRYRPATSKGEATPVIFVITATF